MLQGTRRDELLRVPCRLYDLYQYERDSQGQPVDRSFWKAFTGHESGGQRVKLKWLPHGVNKPLHNGAPLFGIGAPLQGMPAGGTRYQQQVLAVHRRHPEMDVATLLRLKQRPSQTARSEFSYTAGSQVSGFDSQSP